MIKKINIHNFQSHRKSELVFDPGVNYIVGTSDSGKTAIFRAVNWVVSNRPVGEAFRSHWGGGTEVSLVLDCGTSVQRIRTNKDNRYVLEREEGCLDLAAVGKDVPEEITSLLELNDLNIQSQLDAPFLLSSTPGEVAKYLNNVTNLEKIHLSLKYIESARRKAERDIQAAEDQVHRMETQLAELPDLSILSSKVKELETITSEISENQDKVDQVHMCLATILAIKSKIEKLPTPSELGNIIGELSLIESLQDKIKDINLELPAIRSAIDQVKKYMTLVQAEAEELRRLMGEYIENAPEICPTCNQLIDREKLDG